MGKGFHASSSAAFVLALLSLLSPSVLQQPIPSIKPPTYEPSEGYAEGLGIIPMGADAIVYFVFSNVTLSSGLTAGDLDNVESLVMAFTEGDWRAYWKKPIWGYPQGASLDIAYLNVMENEIGAYVERAKRTAARFIRMFGLPRMVVYKLAFDKEANRLSLGLHSGIKSGADVDACLEVWVNAVPLEGLGSLVDVEGIKASPCKSAAICLRREGDGLTSDVFVAYVRPRAIVGSAETNFTLDTYRVVGTLAASEGARHSIVAVMFPYPVRISECEPEPTYPYVEEWDKWGKREWGREWIRDLIMEYGSPEKWRMWREFAREFGFKRSPDERFESMFKERMKGVGRQMSERAERVMESLWKRREGLERKLRIRERLEEIKRRPEEVPIKEWEEEAGLESEYRRNTYAHQGMLAYDLGEEATENILVRYDLAYDPDLLRARPVIMAEAEPVDDLAAIRIKLENAGNETAYMIIVRPLAFPFAKLGEEVLRAGGLPELGRSYRAFIGGIASLAEPIRKLEPGESVIINQTICPKRWRGEFFSHVQALYNPTGCLVLYTDAFHRRYFTTSNGFLAGIEREEKPLLIPTLRLDKYVITAGEEINGELVVRNIGGLDAANISMTVFTAPLFGKRIGLMPLAGIRFRGHRKHARESFEAFLEEEDVEEARKWACFHSTVLAHDENVKISAGSEYRLKFQKKIPWLGSACAIYAFIAFPVDYGDYIAIWDRLPPEMREKLEGRDIVVCSNLATVSVIPIDEKMAGPPFPTLEVSKLLNRTAGISIGDHIGVTIVVRNVGEEAARVSVQDILPLSCKLKGYNATGGTASNETAFEYGGKGVTVVRVEDAVVKPRSTVSLTYVLEVEGELETLDPAVDEVGQREAIIPPVTVKYTSEQPMVDPVAPEIGALSVVVTEGMVPSSEIKVNGPGVAMLYLPPTLDVMAVAVVAAAGGMIAIILLRRRIRRAPGPIIG